MVKANVYLYLDKDGTYSCGLDEKAPLNYGLTGEGKTEEEAISDWNATYEAMKQNYAKRGLDFVEAEFNFVYDIPSFLAYYGRFITYKGLAMMTGLSAAQISQYATCYRNPSPKTAAKIQNGLQTFVNSLSRVRFV